MRPEYKSKNILKTLRPLMGFALLTGGLIAVSPAAEAEGVTAGTDISNTATASYEDPNDPNKPIETISNTVAVKVAKVAGINILSNGTEDLGPNPGAPNNVVGNYAPGDVVAFDYKLINVGNAAVQFSIPGAATVNDKADFQKVQYKNASGAWVDVPNGTAVTIPGFVAVDGFKEVRVLVKIKSTATTNQRVEVTLGSTSGVDIQNAQRGTTPEVAGAADVFTVDITNDPIASGSVPQGNAVNGVREASRVQGVGVNQDTQAFANITMTAGNPVADATNPGDLTKNKITYDISVSVDPTAPTGSNKTPSDLGATPITVDGVVENHVLISNPVPANTTPTKVTAPNGWTAVYSTSPVGTAPELINWLPVPASGVPPTTTPVTFVGFYKTDSTPLPINGGTPYTGFQVELQTTGVDPVNGGSVSNIANVYGSTPNADGTPNITKPIVQDQTGTPTLNTPNGGAPVVTPIAPPGSIFNGPFQKPQAVGPDNTTATDYSNKSVQITAADLVGVNPATGALPNLTREVNSSFTNTLENQGTTAADIYLLPSAPATATDLPDGTLVKITYGNQSITYIYNAGVYTPIAADATKVPVKVTLGSNATDVYGVQVTLPIGTPQLKGYPAPITAFTGAVPAAGDTTVPTGTGVKTNVTIDRVYTGYLKLTKESRILEENANGVKVEVVGFSTTAKSAAPRQFIEYRVKYENVSIGGGTDNVGLSASKVKIEEDGVTAPNTWGNNTTHDANSAINSVNGNVAGTIIFSPAGKDNTNTDVTGYRVELGTNNQVAPGQAGQFSFIRKVK